MANEREPSSKPPAAVTIDLAIDGQKRRLTYEQAFGLASQLLERGDVLNAAKLFERLEEFTDRGPRAFIMQAFCEAAALHFDKCSGPLTEAFSGENADIASALHNAFVSYHVGIRQEALDAMVALVQEHRDLPTLCLLLGNMMRAAGQMPMARRCWSLAVHRDRPGGAVAKVAMHQLRSSDSGIGTSKTDPSGRSQS